jgi:hypothetical protein
MVSVVAGPVIIVLILIYIACVLMNPLSST